LHSHAKAFSTATAATSSSTCLTFLEGKIEGEKFFEENFITSGMKTLFEKTFARLENRGDQASTFLLTQSMGGGKTHNMIALGLLAKNPALREKVWARVVTAAKSEAFG
jgi:predicted AAA+ superfamily ATPase